MPFAFRIGRNAAEAIARSFADLGHAQDLSNALATGRSNVWLEPNGALAGSDQSAGLEAAQNLEFDDETLRLVQDAIRQNGLDARSPLLAQVLRANPPQCNPPFDCGNTILT